MIIRKVIFRIAIGYLIFWLLSYFILPITGLEYSQSTYASDVAGFFAISVPIAILLTLTGTLGKSNGPGRAVGLVLLTIMAAIGSFIIQIVLFMSTWCGVIQSTTIYTYKADDNIQIMTRAYSCDSWDREFVHEKGQYKVHWYGPYLIRATPIDTADIDESQWRVEGSWKNRKR